MEPRSGVRIGNCGPGVPLVNFFPRAPVTVSIWYRSAVPLSMRVASRTVVGSGAECGRPSTATGALDADPELLVAALLLVALLLVAVLLLAGADELAAAAVVEVAGLAVPPMPAQALAAARTNSAAALAPISLPGRPSVPLSPSPRPMTHHPLSRRSLVLRPSAGDNDHPRLFDLVPIARATRSRSSSRRRS